MILWILCFAATVAAQLADIKPEVVGLVKYDLYNPGHLASHFIYSYELTDGTKFEAQGKQVKVVNDDKELEALVIKGSYSYVIDGFVYTVNYVADQNGYQPTIIVEPSDKLPETPPRNALLLASLLGQG